jgi:hypothetical protein
MDLCGGLQPKEGRREEVLCTKRESTRERAMPLKIRESLVPGATGIRTGARDHGVHGCCRR